MVMRRMTEFGCLALFCGLVLLGTALLASPSVSREELSATFGGACQKCKAVPGCKSQKCTGDANGSSKVTGTNQATASCMGTPGIAARECSENTPKPCGTETSCDGAGCTTNCSTITSSTTTNCNLVGTCAASP